MYKLRQYQEDLVEAGLRGFQAGKPFILQAATSAGKSLVIAELTKRLGKPMLVLSPSREILLQNYKKMLAYGIEDVKMYSASVGQKEIGTVTLATIASIYKKPKDFAHFEYALFDELHLFNAKSSNSMYVKFFRETGIKKIGGLTATPFRLDQKFFGDVYTGCVKMLNRMRKDSFFREIVHKVEMKDLIDQGYITRPIYHSTEQDIRGLVVNTTGRDYTEASLNEWGHRRADRMLSVAKELDSKHQRILVFASSISSANTIQESLGDLGIKAEVITGTTKSKDRQRLLDGFQEGRVRWVINVGVLTTGFDMPVLDCVVLLRPTFSIPLYIQILGRGVRLDPDNPDKEYHFYDFTNTVEKFGKAEEIRIVKEDGFKDMLVGEKGRLDNMPLFEFDLKERKFNSNPSKQQELDLTVKHPENPSLDYLLNLV